MNEKRQAMGYGVSENTMLDNYFLPSNLIPVDDLSFDTNEKNFFELGYTVKKPVPGMSDVYTTRQEAEERARELGGSGSHVHNFDGEDVYMPFETHEEYEQATDKYYHEEETKQEKFSGYPKSAINNAKKAIKINEKYNNKCATNVGKQRAKDISNNRAFSLSVLKRVYSYLSRAKEYDTGVYEKDGKPICGTISFNLWGGNSMLTWSKRQLDKLEE